MGGGGYGGNGPFQGSLVVQFIGKFVNMVDGLDRRVGCAALPPCGGGSIEDNCHGPSEALRLGVVHIQKFFGSGI